MVVAQCLQTERCSDISSSLCFSCAMMGLQATSGKRKLDGGVGCTDFDMELGESPSKLSRLESSWWTMDDGYGSSSPTALSQSSSAAYYELEPPSCLQSASSRPCQLSTSTAASCPTSPVSSPSAPSSSSTTCSTTSSSSLPSSASSSPQLPTSTSSTTSPSSSSSSSSPSTTSTISSTPTCTTTPSSNSITSSTSSGITRIQQLFYPPRVASPCPNSNSSISSTSSSSNSSNSSSNGNSSSSSIISSGSNSGSSFQAVSRSSASSAWSQHHHYEPPTIRREENGKSYLELGSSYRANERCCEGSRLSWCRRGRACYRQRRLAVLNISMCKLARYRQFPDPSLHRSVLICNTLRYLEREMERDRSPPPVEPHHGLFHHHHHMHSSQHHHHQQQQQQHQQHHHPHHHHHMGGLGQMPPEHGRITPFPSTTGSSTSSFSSSLVDTTDTDSGIGDGDDSRSINWGSVLSLSSQSPLDPLNNNELLDVDIGPELDLDFMPSWKQQQQQQQMSHVDELIHHQQHQHQQQQLMHQQHHSHLQHSHHQQHQHQQHMLQHSNASSTHDSLMCVSS